VSDQISYPYTTTVKILPLCIIFLKFFESNLEEKRSCNGW
jgi:hypothetical protein